ncbi:MAG TPA: TetR/AcrR family transcriptional regulator [Solimonas sp.]
MGTKERKQREFAEREQRFLDTARELIRRDGLLNLSMARIAEDCDYAVGTLYQHFASKEDLLMALVTEDVRIHADMFERVARWPATPRDRMFAIGVADMIFVRRHPEHFRLAQYAFTEIVWGAASPARRQALLEANEPLGEIVHGLVRDAAARGDLALNGLSPEEVCIGMWSIAIGMHNLVHAEGVLADFTARDPYRLMCRHFQTHLNGLGWNPLFDATDDAALDALIKRICHEVFDDLCSQ